MNTIAPIRAQALVSYSTRWQGAAPLNFLANFAGQPRFYWSDASGALTLAAAGTAASLQASGSERFSSIRDQAKELFAAIDGCGDLDAPAPRLLGGFAFSLDFEAEDIWSGFAPALFVLPKYRLATDENGAWLTINLALEAGEGAGDAARRAEQEAAMLLASTKSGPTKDSVKLDISYPLVYASWERMITTATERIRSGELDKVVLARVAEVGASQPIDPIPLLGRLDAAYPACHKFMVEPEAGRAFLGATPERLAAVRDGELHTEALAGSAPRGANASEDAALGQTLLDSPKDRHEHALVVEALAANLASVSTELQVEAEPSLHKLSNIQHLRTHVSGQLNKDLDILDLIESLHPTPALGGSPREAALTLIEELEPLTRGWYASPVGWFDAAGNGEFAVAIRSAVCAGRQARLYAGAGIVADSQPQAEWDETALKFKPLLEALQGDRHGD